MKSHRKVNHCVPETPDRCRPLVLWLTIITASYAALIAWGAQHRARRALTDSPRERA